MSMNETEYWNEVELLSAEVEDVIAIFYTYEEINRLAVEDHEIWETLQKEALFWNVQAYSLHTSLFIVLARVFDSSGDAHSIHKLINATLSNIHFFSKQALAKRKMAGGPKPEWLDDYVARAWAPSAARDLRHLKISLREYDRRFKKVYLPIRNKIFAHKAIADSQAVFALFEKASHKEIAATLDFLHDLIEAICNLYLNGIKPELGQRSHGEGNRQIKRGAENVLRKLAKAGSPSA